MAEGCIYTAGNVARICEEPIRDLAWIEAIYACCAKTRYELAIEISPSFDAFTIPNHALNLLPPNARQQNPAR